MSTDGDFFDDLADALTLARSVPREEAARELVWAWHTYFSSTLALPDDFEERGHALRCWFLDEMCCVLGWPTSTDVLAEQARSGVDTLTAWRRLRRSREAVAA